MAHIINKNQVEMKYIQPKLKEFSWHKSEKLSGLFDSEDYVFDIKKIPPGSFSYPYHFHHNCEEIFVILKGQISLRTPDGFKILSENDIAFFEKGPSGAHHFFNHSKEDCTYLDLRSKKDLDICEYPDSDKINVMGKDISISLKGKKVDYFYGEDQVKEKWQRQGYVFESV